MANGRTGVRKARDKAKPAENYRHPTSESLMRPEVGVQAQFKKKLPPKKYRYDDSLSPALEWDGQNPALFLEPAQNTLLRPHGLPLPWYFGCGSKLHEEL